MKDNGNFRTRVIVVGGVKYMFISSRSPAGIVGKKGPSSILIRETIKAIVMVITNDGVNPTVITSIDTVADDIKKKGGGESFSLIASLQSGLCLLLLGTL